jgi:outer membrane lipoprotein SlyB
MSVRQVNVNSSDNSTGGVLGGVAGGVAGSTIGHGSSAHALGAIGGALAGMAVGSLAQDSMMSQAGYEYVVRTDSGQIYSVTQGTDTLLSAGQRCMLLNGATSRVIPYY